jgi:hypothetical protein
VSLYYVQKFLFEFNRDPAVQESYEADRDAAIDSYDLTDEERAALVEPDFGKLFHLGVNGQILMHFGAFHQVPWQDYLRQLAAGIEEHGPVREGVYAVTGYEGVDAHAASLDQESNIITTTTQGAD